MRKFLVLAVAIVPLALAACGDDDETTSAGATDTTAAETTTAASGGAGGSVAIKETEFVLDPSDPTTGAGPVSIEVTNDGSIPHDLEVEGNGIEEVTDTIEPGGSATLDVDLEPGSYKIYCTIGDHEEQGMVGELTAQ